MKLLYTITLLLISITAPGQTTEGLTAEQILDFSIAFCGGESRIAKIKTSDINYILIQPDKSTAIISEKRKIGLKFGRSLLSMTHVPQTTFFDGKKLSRVEGASVTHATEMKAIEEVKLLTYNQIQYGYKKLNYELTRLPDRKFKSFDCYVVNAKADNGYTAMNFFDKTNFRLLMVVYPNGNKSMMIEYVFRDSVLFNSHIVNAFVNSEDLQVFKLRNLHTNTNISDLWFDCPYRDTVYIPPYIKTGEFESVNGTKTIFERTGNAQDYRDEQGNFLIKRLLKWANNDTYGLIDEKAVMNNDKSPESNILVRIISWDDDEYVCQWIAGKYTDTQDYKIKR